MTSLVNRVLAIAEKQREYYDTGQTRPIPFRLNQLRLLRKTLLAYQEEIQLAFHQDLRKPAFEVFTSETGFVMAEIDHALKKLKKWAKPTKKKSPLTNFKTKASVVNEPYGVVLIIAPWNYPINLALVPLVGAIMAGNCAVVKPSELTPSVSSVIAKIIQSTFSPQYISVVEGEVEVAEALLAIQWDYIFFTGSPEVGKIVYKAAANHLTPVTLELGGKCPCLIDGTTDLRLTVKSTLWGKFFNGGQTCVAPDYLLVNESIRGEFLELVKTVLVEFYGLQPKNSPDLTRIVNLKHFQRLVGYLEDPSLKVVVGGDTDEEKLFISPTVVEVTKLDIPLMEEEIFGPILPIVWFSSLQDALDVVLPRNSPLVLYLFSQNKATQQFMVEKTRSGSVAINDTLLLLSNPHLPFGGVGNSGIGRYHGKSSFDTFSSQRSLFERSTHLRWSDRLRNPPYSDRKLGWVKRVFKWFF